jgi:uncharacterized protein (DUF58 family)
MAFANWLRIASPDSRGVAEIAARRIYILPTRYGLIFATLLFLMLIGAVNYGNNPAHLLTFLLAGLAGNAIYLTWRNLHGLQLRCEGAAPIFAGDDARFVWRVDPGERDRPAVQLGLPGGSVELLDLAALRTATVTLALPGLPRGLHDPGRVVVSTVYPLGLFRAWCYVDVDRRVLVYPRPGADWTPTGHGGERTLGTASGRGNEDFAGLRDYVDGDPPSQIDWKSYARERGLNTRLFTGAAASPLWLSWDEAPGLDDEARLKSLARAVVDNDAAGRRYGLRMPDREIAPGMGPRHRHRCLRELALYGTADA